MAMNIDGSWWYLMDEEPFDENITRQLSFTDGMVLDARTDERLGAYSIEGDRLEVQLDSGVRIVGITTDATPTFISATAQDGEFSVPVLLNRTEGRVIPLFSEVA
jgi:hypothetical protein